MTSHVVAMGGGGFPMDDPLLDRYVVDLVRTDVPRLTDSFLLGRADGGVEETRLPTRRLG